MAKYNNNNIIHYHGLEGIRRNAAMYIGDTGTEGLFLVARELLDNALDEALAGRNNFVGIAILPDGSILVQDRGAGIPQGTKTINMVVSNKKTVNKLPTMQAVFGELHTSGKYNTEAYKVSRGSHGLGVKSTNATATMFKVATVFNGKTYAIGFEKGTLTQPVKTIPPIKKAPFGALRKGTLIHFKPDESIFGKATFSYALLEEWASITSYLTPGFEIVAKYNGKTQRWHSTRGVLDYIDARMKATESSFILQDATPLFEHKDELSHIVVAFTTLSGSEIRGFTSGLSNRDGGVHVDAVYKSLYAGIEQYKRKRGAVPFTLTDFKDGLLGLINVNLHKAQFTGQNKAKLSDERIGKEFIDTLTKQAITFFGKHKQLRETLLDKASALASLRTKFKASAAAQRELNKAKRYGMPLKYAGCDPKTPIAQREIYLTEGDSASGTCKLAKFPFQAILPLRGKILNVLTDASKAGESTEIINILAAIGYDAKAADPVSKLQVSKIIFLPDGDEDGKHIGALLAALFYKYLPELYDNGMIYVAETYEFYATYKSKLYMADNLVDLRAKMNAAKVPASVPMKHIKGWGEVDAPILRLMALDPSTRKLVRLDTGSKPKLIEQIMGKDTTYRKQMLGISV